MYNSKLLMSPEDIKEYLDRLFDLKTRQKLTTWSAEILDLCRPRSIDNFYTFSSEGDTRLETEFQIRLSKTLSNTEILDLLIISYHLPPDGQFILQEGIRNIEKLRHLDRDISYRIYSSGYNYTLLYLIHSRVQIRSFNGSMRRTISKVLGDSNAISAGEPSSIFLPFWSTPTKDNVKRYTGWSKHVKDQGSQRPDVTYLTNHKDDQWWQEQNFKKLQESRQRFEDTLSLILGIIS